MKNRSLLIPGLLVSNLVFSGYLLVSRDSAPVDHRAVVRKEVAKTDDDTLDEIAKLHSLVSELRDQVGVVSAPGGEGSRVHPEDNEEGRRLAARLKSMENSLAALEMAMEGVDIEAASEKRDELFKGVDGDVKAAEYFEAGKYALAGEGYLTFLATHPTHPQHRSIVQRARQAFMRAGNVDKAIAVHEEFMELYPENRPSDLMTLAHMQKESGDFGAAAQSAQDSADLVNDSSKYWNLLYSAWYTQLGDGLSAGLTAHRDVQQQINAAGFSDSKMADRVQEKIAEIESQMAAEGK